MSDDYPGEPLDDRRPRRRQDDYRRDSELDGQWGAADDEDIADEGLEIEDFAGQYIWDEPMRLRDEEDEPVDPTDTSGLGPLPPSAKRLKQRRPDQPRETRIRDRYDRSKTYANSPSFHKSKKGRLERAFSHLTGGDPAVPQKARRDPGAAPGATGHLPLWAILILVMLGLAAILVALLACASLFTLLN